MLTLRPALASDADAVADVLISSRRVLVACAPLVHSDSEIRTWVRETLIPAGGLTVAETGGVVVAFVAVSRDADGGWIDQLYVVPEHVGRGIGTRLLQAAREHLSSPIRPYTFQENQRARSFYEHHGFRAVAFGDGSGNEERCPDILFEWADRRRDVVSDVVDLSKTLEQLEGDVWGEPNYDSYLLRTVHALRRKPIGDFTIEDLRIMLGQKIGMPFLVPLALDRLDADAFAEGHFYPGDLMVSVLGLPPDYWAAGPVQAQRMALIADRVARTLATRDESDEIKCHIGELLAKEAWRV